MRQCRKRGTKNSTPSFGSGEPMEGRTLMGFTELFTASECAYSLPSMKRSRAYASVVERRWS